VCARVRVRACVCLCNNTIMSSRFFYTNKELNV